MEGETSGDDILQQGGRRFRLPQWRPSRGAGLLAVAALVVGLAAGYAAGNAGARSSAARPQPTVTASPPRPTSTQLLFLESVVGQGTGECSVQRGKDDLELGIQLTNLSAQRLTLTTVKAVLPQGGLKQLSWDWGTCGAVGSAPGTAADVLPPGKSAWLTVTFLVQVRCPGPLQVHFDVGYQYQAQGLVTIASLPGFPDLSGVSYNGC